MTIIECISSLKNLYHSEGATDDSIAEVEKKLNLRLADDYKEYVSKYGVISAKRIELTGIISSKRLNVADVTLNERELNPNFPDDMYVIENIGIDGILLLQKTNGSIYEFIPNKIPVKVYDNLTEYLRTKI
ncbi:hypothetical protein E4N85_07655 [Treponema denticola]|uniref:SMI1/KNR4 family protein n=1 Tax=Treponema denticola TaxID=158 RepID=UPI0020A619F1|nr:SMI1/KNR4 family protein [Treponema denticola]UTC95607.1 hypothetical protein E4N85_07655 [Treponema denticola]